MQIGSKLWIAATVILTLAQVVASVLLPRGFALAAISDCLAAGLMLALLLACATNAALSPGRLRAFWVLQAIGWFFSLTDQGIFIKYDIFLRKPMPMIFSGDVLLYLPSVLMLAGLLLRPHLQHSARRVREGMADFLLLILWWVYFYVSLVMCWQYAFRDETLYNLNYDRLYVVEILVLLGVLGLLLKHSGGPWKRFYAYLLCSVVFNTLCFLMENRAIEANVYYSGSWYDIPYSAAFAFFMLTAMKGRGLTLASETAEEQKIDSWMVGLAIVAVLSLPVIVATVVLERWAPPEIMRFRVLTTAVTMFIMAALVFIKQRWLHMDLKRANRELEEVSMTDPLTGARNRRFFSMTINRDVTHSLRAHTNGQDRSTRDLIFYLIDLDDFKEVNDLHGHNAGDRLLVEISRRISSAIRNCDLLVRWGGEEFLVVSRFTDRTQAEILAQRVIAAVRKKPIAISSEVEIHRTCSIGWAAFPWREDDINAMGYEEVLNLADRGLYEAKKSGKDRAIGMTPHNEGQGWLQSAGSAKP